MCEGSVGDGGADAEAAVAGGAFDDVHFEGAVEQLAQSTRGAFASLKNVARVTRPPL